MGIPKIQHYVPQFLLKYFSVRKKPQVYVFDKFKNKSFLSHIKNLASESGFYDFQFNGIELSFEDSLSEIESRAKKIFDKIIKDKSLVNLNNDEIIECANFIAIQFIRTKRHRETIEQINSKLIETIKNRGWEISEDSDIKLMNDEEIKEMSLHTLLEVDKFSKHFLDKDWLLLKTSKNHPFYISDNPVVMQNLIDRWPRGNIGLAVEGIEIYFPISSDFCMSFLCKSWNKIFHEILEKHELYKEHPIYKQENLQIDIDNFEGYIAAIEKGEPKNLKPENVENINSLQVINSSRFVFCGYDKFELVKSLIAENETFKKAPEIIVT